MKRIWRLVLCIALLPGLLAACGGAPKEGVSIDREGWLHFKDDDRQAAYLVLAPGESAFSPGPGAGPSPDPQEAWQPVRVDSRIPTEDGTLTLALPARIWQDGPRPAKKLYALLREEFTFYNFKGEKSVRKVAGYYSVAGLVWSPEEGAWLPWFPPGDNLLLDLQGFTGIADSEELSGLLQRCDEALQDFPARAQSLKNAYARLSGREDYLG